MKLFKEKYEKKSLGLIDTSTHYSLQNAHLIWSLFDTASMYHNHLVYCYKLNCSFTIRLKYLLGCLCLLDRG